MDFKVYLKNAIQQIENEKEREIQQVKAKAMQEKIIPYNNEVDKAKDEAILKLNDNLNSKVAQLREEFEISKQTLIDATNKKKNDFMVSTLELETNNVNAKCNSVISNLTKMLNDLGE